MNEDRIHLHIFSDDEHNQILNNALNPNIDQWSALSIIKTLVLSIIDRNAVIDDKFNIIDYIGFITDNIPFINRIHIEFKLTLKKNRSIGFTLKYNFKNLIKRGLYTYAKIYFRKNEQCISKIIESRRILHRRIRKFIKKYKIYRWLNDAIMEKTGKNYIDFIAEHDQLVWSNDIEFDHKTLSFWYNMFTTKYGHRLPDNLAYIPKNIVLCEFLQHIRTINIYSFFSNIIMYRHKIFYDIIAYYKKFKGTKSHDMCDLKICIDNIIPEPFYYNILSDADLVNL